jgi:NAD(P)-dependent dehydrogenase (short-subunit alcohol dehydrogenase family)
MDMFDLSGHVSVVTGGNRGIGLGMARGLARANASIALWARDLELAEKAVAELRDLGRRGRGVRLRRHLREGCRRGPRRHHRPVREGRLSVRQRRDDLRGVLPGDGAGGARSSVFEVNVGGVFLVTREVARHLIARDSPGSIVITSSIAAHHGLPTAPHYSASKGAATAFARALAVRLARHRIRVNVIAPGWMATEMTDELQGHDRFEASLQSRVPMRRWGGAEDFEGAAVYLASEASSFMTGAELTIDGGYSAY